MCWIGAERPACSHKRDVRARKQHDCCECDVPIKPGDVHEVVSGIWDGRPDRYRTCLGCVALRAEVIAHERKDGCLGDDAIPPFGELYMAAREYGLLPKEAA